MIKSSKYFKVLNRCFQVSQFDKYSSLINTLIKSVSLYDILYTSGFGLSRLASSNTLVKCPDQFAGSHRVLPHIFSHEKSNDFSNVSE